MIIRILGFPPAGVAGVGCCALASPTTDGDEKAAAARAELATSISRRLMPLLSCSGFRGSLLPVADTVFPPSNQLSANPKSGSGRGWCGRKLGSNALRSKYVTV